MLMRNKFYAPNNRKLTRHRSLRISCFCICWFTIWFQMNIPIWLSWRVANWPHFKARTRPEAEITRPNPARARHLVLNPGLVRKPNFPSVSRYEHCGISKTVVYEHSCNYTISSHPK